jgi:hypothetical protein
LFIPNKEIGKNFDALLNMYPITPYLDSKESLCRWLWHINNKINEHLEKPKISLNDFYKNYYNLYKNKESKNKELLHFYKKILFLFIILVFIGVGYFLYKI